MPLALAGFTLCCLVEQCPYLVEFSALIESLVSSSMYTKFSEALSIKYPEELNTAYPAAGSGNERLKRRPRCRVQVRAPYGQWCNNALPSLRASATKTPKRIAAQRNTSCGLVFLGLSGETPRNTQLPSTALQDCRISKRKEIIITARHPS